MKMASDLALLQKNRYSDLLDRKRRQTTGAGRKAIEKIMKEFGRAKFRLRVSMGAKEMSKAVARVFEDMSDNALKNGMR